MALCLRDETFASRLFAIDSIRRNQVAMAIRSRGGVSSFIIQKKRYSARIRLRPRDADFPVSATIIHQRDTAWCAQHMGISAGGVCKSSHHSLPVDAELNRKNLSAVDPSIGAVGALAAFQNDVDIIQTDLS